MTLILAAGNLHPVSIQREDTLMADDFRALAIDLGASNGRALLGTLRDNGTLEMQELRRFVNRLDDGP